MSRKHPVDRPYIPTYLIEDQDSDTTHLHYYHVHNRPRRRKTPVVKRIFKSQYVSAKAKVSAIRTTGNPGSLSYINENLTDSTDFIGKNTFIGSTNPYWKDQMRNNESATTQASGTKFNYTNYWLTAEKSWLVKSTGQRVRVEMFGNPKVTTNTQRPPSASDMSKADDRAKSKFLNKLDQTLSSVELGQDLGEYKETVHGITNPLGGLRKLTVNYLDALTKMRKGFKSKPIGDPLKAVADAYLEYTFGWRPLALDIADAYVGLKERAHHYNVVPIHAGSKNIYDGGYSPPVQRFTDGANALAAKYSVRSQYSYTVRYKGIVKRNLVNGTIPVLDVLQIDLPHFIPTVWDLIPYSFIVDYFTNVGDIVRAFSARTNQVGWCVRTTRTLYHHDVVNSFVDTHNPTPGPNVDVYGLREDGQTSIVEQVDFNRISYPAAALMPAFHFELPNSSKPWMNIGALLTSRLSRLIPFI